MGTFDYFNRKPFIIAGEGGAVTYNYYEIPFEYTFTIELAFEYTFTTELAFEYNFTKES